MGSFPRRHARRGDAAASAAAGGTGPQTGGGDLQGGGRSPSAPQSPVCSLMYLRPFMAYSRGSALAGSCSASTSSQPW